MRQQDIKTSSLSRDLLMLCSVLYTFLHWNDLATKSAIVLVDWYLRNVLKDKLYIQMDRDRFCNTCSILSILKMLKAVKSLSNNSKQNVQVCYLTSGSPFLVFTVILKFQHKHLRWEVWSAQAFNCKTCICMRIRDIVLYILSVETIKEA